MELAAVVGSCTATTKDESLVGRRLALVRRVDPEGRVVGEVEAAVDLTSAGVGSTVLIVRGSAVRQSAATRTVASDLAIVAIVDDIDVAGGSAKRAEHNQPGGAKYA